MTAGIRASTSSESSKRGQIISQFSRVFNTFDYDSLDDLVTDDWTFHYYLGIETLEEFKVRSVVLLPHHKQPMLSVHFCLKKSVTNEPMNSFFCV